MSRTEKDKPYWVLEKENSWRLERGYPGAVNGAWRSADEKSYWSRERMKERRSARYFEEVEPSRHRHQAKWDCW